MEITWLCIITFMFLMFAILDGFDFGAGMLNLFIARNEKERMLIKRSIGPFWDGNEVWLVASGGLLFMAFPRLYASFFSGFYLPLIMILWLIMGRGLSLELRNQMHNELWKSMWDKIFGVASLLLALVFGIAFGNILRGVNLGGVVKGVSAYEPHFFFAPLWTDFLQPENPGVIGWFSLFVGIITVITLMIHGGNWVILKIDSEFSIRIKKFTGGLTWLLIVLMLLSFYLIEQVNPGIYNNYKQNVVLLLVPTGSMLALLMSYFLQKQCRELSAFIASSLFIAGMFVAAVIAIFPVVLPSTNSVNPGLTIYSVANNEYGLAIGLTWWVVGISLIFGYSFMVHWKYRGKIADDTEIYYQYH